MIISFLLPVYKSQHLAEAIDSILNQTYTDFELIIVNDASPDDVDSIIANYKDTRIHYYKNKTNIGNVNLIDQWNMCLNHAKGEWTVMASDDDIYDSNYLQEMVDLIQTYPNSNVFHCNIYNINDDGDICDIAMPCSREESCLEHLYFRLVRGRLHAFPEFTLRTDLLKKHGGYKDFPLATFSDCSTLIDVAGSYPIICSSKYLFSWRNNGENISSSPHTAYSRFLACEQAYRWCLSYIHSNTERTKHEQIIYQKLDKNIRLVFVNYEKHLISIMELNDMKTLLNTYTSTSKLLIPKSYIQKNLLIKYMNKKLSWK